MMNPSAHLQCFLFCFRGQYIRARDCCCTHHVVPSGIARSLSPSLRASQAARAAVKRRSRPSSHASRLAGTHRGPANRAVGLCVDLLCTLYARADPAFASERLRAAGARQRWCTPPLSAPSRTRRRSRSRARVLATCSVDANAVAEHARRPSRMTRHRRTPQAHRNRENDSPLLTRTPPCRWVCDPMRSSNSLPRSLPRRNTSHGAGAPSTHGKSPAQCAGIRPRCRLASVFGAPRRRRSHALLRRGSS
ncbi:hypothetical protein B0H15DRAFT_808410 [Mycena belliarum]|uniref:Uncharacterized protein n=1 Tax=Mycena belliarum TaxID=1033014 RepID=A0AAD6UIY2_9AGAR|nr:hypothetical protein B0H15DRAFT_808410 [Mycena belliae]